MCSKQMNMDELVSFVLRQVPEADPNDIRSYARQWMKLPCDPSEAYACARTMEIHLVLKGSI